MAPAFASPTPELVVEESPAQVPAPVSPVISQANLAHATIYDTTKSKRAPIHDTGGEKVSSPYDQLVSAGSAGNAGDDKVVLNYSPYAGVERWVKYRFSAWSSYKAWFAMALIVIFFGFGGPGKILDEVTRQLEALTRNPEFIEQMHATSGYSAPANSTLPFLFLFFAAFAALVAARYLSHPTHVALDADGVCLLWKRGKFSHGIALPWQRMKKIDLIWPADKTSPQDCFINFEDTGGSSIGKQSIKLKLGSIATIEERHNLLKAIERWGGTVARDPELMDILTPPSDGSYTELWLQALSAPPKRERLTPLAPQAVLQENKYMIVGQLGVGGQGTAYEAVRQEDGLGVVLKEFILPVYVDINVRKQSLENMQNEASMLRRLDNERIVRLLEFFVEDHRGYLVLEKINGLSLRQIVQNQGKLGEHQVRDLAMQMCKMLDYLHSLTPPVVHRDFTPDNLILGNDGVLKLVDFNVAQQTESTATGTVVGKHAYLPPEQFRGKPTTQSDIYAMGATLYYLLVGQDPEPITCSHAKLLCVEVSDQLDELIARSTALDAKKRTANAKELQDDLQKSWQC